MPSLLDAALATPGSPQYHGRFRSITSLPGSRNLVNDLAAKSSTQSPAAVDTRQNRRSFLHTTSAATVAGSVAALSAPMAHASVDDVIKVGLIGCGGRGNSAAKNAMNADPNARLTALCDLFPDRLERASQVLTRQLGPQYDVPPDQTFSGFDGYKQLLQTDIDVVLLCTPPHFRPAQLQASIDAGKHVFCEKPVAVDPVGVRRVLDTSRIAKEKDLSIVSGLCWRYDYGVRETMQRILDGQIGDVTAIQENYLTGPLWHRGRKDDWSEMEYQCRNWMYFTWLSGDHIVEQHIHSLDKALWLMGDQPPARCVGLGGREVRTAEKWGNIFDHFAICYEWENGVKTFAYTRQMRGCKNQTEDFVIGSKGRAQVLAHRLQGATNWEYKGPKPSMYDVEHQELFAGIRKGEHINNGEYMSYSTLMAIMGREACYTGQEITLKAALDSDMDLSPASYEWGDVPVPSVAIPGETKFA